VESLLPGERAEEPGGAVGSGSATGGVGDAVARSLVFSEAGAPSDETGRAVDAASGFHDPMRQESGSSVASAQGSSLTTGAKRSQPQGGASPGGRDSKRHNIGDAHRVSIAAQALDLVYSMSDHIGSGQTDKVVALLEGLGRGGGERSTTYAPPSTSQAGTHAAVVRSGGVARETRSAEQVIEDVRLSVPDFLLGDGERGARLMHTLQGALSCCDDDVDARGAAAQMVLCLVREMQAGHVAQRARMVRAVTEVCSAAAAAAQARRKVAA
jgi:hypothetical protein